MDRPPQAHLLRIDDGTSGTETGADAMINSVIVSIASPKAAIPFACNVLALFPGLAPGVPLESIQRGL